jgi:hypothetical protein
MIDRDIQTEAGLQLSPLARRRERGWGRGFVRCKGSALRCHSPLPNPLPQAGEGTSSGVE